MMNLNDLEKTLSGLVMDLKPAPEPPADYVPFESMEFDRSEKDNSKWIELITGYLNTAKTFEIHCWNEEQEYINLALQFGRKKILSGMAERLLREKLISILRIGL